MLAGSGRLKRLLNFYVPFLGAGVRVDRITPDYLEIDVSMGLHFFNRNAMGTHFGGSLYAMTDPFYMLMLMERLGPAYIVWDKAASIDFVAPGRGRVMASFRLTHEEIERIKAEAESGRPVLPEYRVEVLDERGGLVAAVSKTLYVRKKKPEAIQAP